VPPVVVVPPVPVVAVPVLAAVEVVLVFPPVPVSEVPCVPPVLVLLHAPTASAPVKQEMTTQVEFFMKSSLSYVVTGDAMRPYFAAQARPAPARSTCRP
jgi:hypothetical protein